MKLALRIILPLLILGGAYKIAVFFVENQPKPFQRPSPVQVTKVDATRLKPMDYQVILDSRGAVRPRTTTTLIPEVSGRIVEIAPNFREGGFFKKGDVLAKIDPVDYETAIVIQEGAVAEAKRVLSEEEARSQQALENWTRLGKKEEPSDLVMRKPQLAEAEARLKAANAELTQRTKDLERTKIEAPFDGRLLEQSVDVGQYVSPGTQLARAFSTDVMEVRLPLSNQQLAFIDLPGGGEATDGPEVKLTADLGLENAEWLGRIVRVDSQIDQMSRQLFVVAQVRDPFGENSGAAPLKIGLFVDADVEGRKLEGVFVLPRRAVRVGGEVVVIDKENKIRRQKIKTLWEDRENVVIPGAEGGVNAGDVICLTPLAFPANGALVSPTIDGVAPTTEITGGDGYRGGKGGKGGKGKGEKGKGKGKPPEQT